jgi:hypothetical protein
MPPASRDLDYLQTGIQELERYLISSELFWPLGGRGDLPRLTIGGLLLARKRLQVNSSSISYGDELSRLDRAMTGVYSKWGGAWEKKKAQEVSMRLHLWQNFLQDYPLAPQVQAEAYPQQVELRVMLQLLGEAAEVRESDKILRTFWIAGSFVWLRELSSSFPDPEYWYLYGHLQAKGAL